MPLAHVLQALRAAATLLQRQRAAAAAEAVCRFIQQHAQRSLGRDVCRQFHCGACILKHHDRSKVHAGTAQATDKYEPNAHRTTGHHAGPVRCRALKAFADVRFSRHFERQRKFKRCRIGGHSSHRHRKVTGALELTDISIVSKCPRFFQSLDFISVQYIRTFIHT